MVFNFPKYLVWVVLLLTTELPLAQVPPPVNVENTLRVYPLDAHARLLVDSSASLDFEATHRPDILEKFRPFYSSSVLLDPDRAYWLKTQITAKDNRTRPHPGVPPLPRQGTAGTKIRQCLRNSPGSGLQQPVIFHQELQGSFWGVAE